VSSSDFHFKKGFSCWDFFSLCVRFSIHAPRSKPLLYKFLCVVFSLLVEPFPWNWTFPFPTCVYTYQPLFAGSRGFLATCQYHPLSGHFLLPILHIPLPKSNPGASSPPFPFDSSWCLLSLSLLTWKPPSLYLFPWIPLNFLGCLMPLLFSVPMIKASRYPSPFLCSSM